jgi:PKD repeat protein
MTLSNAVRGLIALALALSFLASSAPASTYADSDNQTGIDNITADQAPIAASDNQANADNITAGQAPIADFMADPTFTYVNTDIQFTDVSTGNPTSWAWDFDNNGTIDSTEQNPMYRYPAAGTYTVKLTVSNEYGSDTKTMADYITVDEVPASGASKSMATSTPLTTGESLAEISSMSNAATPLVPMAPDTSTINLSVYPSTSPHWQACFSDDGNTSYVFTTSNSSPYPTDLYNLTDFTQPFPTCNINFVTVYIRAFATNTPTQDSARTAISTGTTTYYGPWQRLTTSWNTYSTSYTTYPGGGAWTWTQINDLQAGASLRRPAGSGTQSMVTAVWVVVDYGPTANFWASPTSGCAPFTVIFTDNSTNGPTSWSWSFPGGNPLTATGQGPHTIVYSSAGSWDVTLTVSTNSCSDTKTLYNYITLNPTPTVTISGNPNRCGGTSTTLTANVTGGTTPYSYRWYPGNTTTPSVTASTTDNYTVTVTDSRGCQGRAKTVVTANPSLSVTLSGNNSLCQGSTTPITATVTGGTPPYTYDWSASLAQGSWSSDNNTFIASGPGTVIVTVTDGARCRGVVVSDMNTKVTAGNVPGASYPYNAILAWVHPNWWPGLTGYRFGYSSENVSQWIWESYRPIHPVEGDIVYFERSFNIPGTPTGATLYITCDNGYEVSINSHLLGSAQLLTGWGPGHLTNGCVPLSGWESVESWTVPTNWLYNGANVLNITGVNEYVGPLDNPSVPDGTVDGNPGAVIYELVYESISNCGCRATSNVITVTRNPSPAANFTAAPLSGTAPLTVTFTDNSTGANSWSWSFPGGSPSSASVKVPPPVIYNNPGSYNATLIVYNTYGCSDNTTKTINVNPQPAAPTVDAIEIYDSPSLNNPVSLSNPMSPLATYYAKVSITSNDKLNYLQTVQVIIFYNSSGSDNMTAPTSSNTQTCAILTWTAASDNWTIAPSGGGTTWSLLNSSCSHPSDLTGTTGDWIFAFKPGKVATENTGAADWDAQGKATNKSSLSGVLYVRHKGMNWYGEITVSTTSVAWGSVPLGLKFGDAPNPKTPINITYIANGNYYQDIKSDNWTSGGETVALDTNGGNPPSGTGQFALKANAISDNTTWRTVTRGYNHINSSGTITSEAGNTVTTNTLWLSLSPAGILPGNYTGTIYYQIAKRP